jgi:hypothetical protein
MMAAVRKEQIVGAWWPGKDARRGKTGYLIVYFTETGTAHAGDLRKPWRVPDEARSDVNVLSKISEASFEAPKSHPLLFGTDKALAEAFERLLKEPSFAKLNLTKWEFELAADAPGVFLKWGGFTWKQRKYLREIVKKIVAER